MAGHRSATTAVDFAAAVLIRLPPKRVLTSKIRFRSELVQGYLPLLPGVGH